MRNSWKQLVSRGVLLYSQGWHALSQNSEEASDEWHWQPQTAIKTQRKVIILARLHYREWQQQYSAPSTKALKQILALECQASPGQRYLHIAPLEEGRYAVTFWQPDPTLWEALALNGCWVIPETLLLAKDSSVAVVNTLQDIVFVSSSAQGVTSTSRRLGCANLTTFCWSAGVAEKTPTHTVEQSQYPHQLLAAMRQTAPLWLGRCYVTKPRDLAQLQAQLKPAMIASGGVLALYLAISSGYIYQHQLRLNEQYQQRSAEITSVLAKQALVDKQLKLYQEGQKNLEQLNLSWRVWGVMLSLVEHDIRLNQIEYSADQVILRGDAQSATQLLTALSSHPGVADAKFINAVSRQRGKERFSIAFTLKGEANVSTQ
jgi:hypothetical protein